MNPQRLLVSVAGASIVAVIAAGSTALALPKSCTEIMVQRIGQGWIPGAPAPDGDYQIEPAPGAVFTVHCKDMATAPKEYLTLQRTGVSSNFSAVPACGSWSYGTSVRTSFTKIRIDPTTLLVDIGDLTFATSTGEINLGSGQYIREVPYAVAADCNCNYWGLTNIDLRDTPFEVFDVFFAQGLTSYGIVSHEEAPVTFCTYEDEDYVPPPGLCSSLGRNDMSHTISGKLINIRAGGNCGGAGPEGFNSTFHSWISTPRASKLALQLRYVGS
jgi:hypothetical protein